MSKQYIGWPEGGMIEYPEEVFERWKGRKEMKEETTIRPIRFFCKGCGKELWQGIKYKDFTQETIGEILAQLKCSDCILKDFRQDENWRSTP